MVFCCCCYPLFFAVAVFVSSSVPFLSSLPPTAAVVLCLLCLVCLFHGMHYQVPSSKACGWVGGGGLLCNCRDKSREG